MSDTPFGPTKLSRTLLLGTLLFSLALIVLVLAVARGNVAVASAVEDGPVLVGPGWVPSDAGQGAGATTQVSTNLEAGTHGIWLSPSEIAAPDDVTIVGPDGAPVAVRAHASTLTLNASRAGDELSLQLAFDAPTTGSYTIIATDAAPAAALVIGPAEAVGSALVIAGVAAAAVGVLLMIVGLAQHWWSRSSGRRSRPGDPVLR